MAHGQLQMSFFQIEKMHLQLSLVTQTVPYCK
jgi:hypothetical protein